MTAFAALLVSASVLLHVSWNLAGKHQHPTAAFLLVANLFGGLAMLPFVWVYAERLGDVPASVWGVLAATGVCQAAYCVALVAAYRVGDLSLAYPIARSIPPVVVLIASVALGRADRISELSAVGIGVLCAGGLMLPMRRFGELRLASYANACCALALVAALATAGYSLLDDTGLRLLRTLPQRPFEPQAATLLYAPLEAYATCFWLGIFVVAQRREREWLREVVNGRLLAALGVGIALYGSYTLVLGAMSYVEDVSYVVAFRQLSVPLGALAGIVLLGESGAVPKLVGAAVMCVGLLLVGLG